MTTFFLPLKSDSFTSFWRWAFNTKSGAAAPTEIAMRGPPWLPSRSIQNCGRSIRLMIAEAAGVDKFSTRAERAAFAAVGMSKRPRRLRTGEAFERPPRIEAPGCVSLRLRGCRGGRLRRSRLRCRRRSRLHRIILVVEPDNLLRDVDLVRRVDHRSLLRGSIEDNRVTIFLRVLVEHLHHLAADAVDDLLLSIVEIVLRLLLLALITASHLVAFARQPSLFLITQGC